jgi:hypothetical protein
MLGSSRKPWDLAQRMSRRLQRTNVDQRGQADALIAWASWNLDTGQLGWDVLQRARPDGDENFTGHTMHIVEMAAMNLAFRGVVSAMDQLAGAVFRLTGEPLSADRERSVAWWFSRGNKPWAKVPAPLARWLRGFDGNATWQLATELRHGFTHRTVPRHITIHIGGPPPGGMVELEVGGVRYETAAAISRLLRFGNERYSVFERRLAESYPMK